MTLNKGITEHFAAHVEACPVEIWLQIDSRWYICGTDMVKFL